MEAMKPDVVMRVSRWWWREGWHHWKYRLPCPAGITAPTVTFLTTKNLALPWRCERNAAISLAARPRQYGRYPILVEGRGQSVVQWRSRSHRAVRGTGADEPGARPVELGRPLPCPRRSGRVSPSSPPPGITSRPVIGSLPLDVPAASSAVLPRRWAADVKTCVEPPGMPFAGDRTRTVISGRTLVGVGARPGTHTSSSVIACAADRRRAGASAGRPLPMAVDGPALVSPSPGGAGSSLSAYASVDAPDRQWVTPGRCSAKPRPHRPCSRKRSGGRLQPGSPTSRPSCRRAWVGAAKCQRPARHSGARSPSGCLRTVNVSVMVLPSLVVA